MFVKSHTYSIPHTWFLLTRQQKINPLGEPLVTMQRLEEMFAKVKEEIIEGFEEKFTAQNQKIVDLEGKSALQEKKN